MVKLCFTREATLNEEKEDFKVIGKTQEFSNDLFDLFSIGFFFFFWSEIGLIIEFKKCKWPIHLAFANG